jgi:integrase
MNRTSETLPIAALVDDFLVKYDPKRRVAPKAKTTCRLMRQTMRELLEDPRLTTSAQLNRNTIYRWIDRHPERTPITLAVHLRNLRVFWNYAVGEGYTKSSPFVYERDFKKMLAVEKPATRRHHSLVEIGCVLGSLRDLMDESWEALRLYALASTVAHTGVRALEAQYTEVHDFDLDTEFLKIEPKPIHALKTNRSKRLVPIPPELMPVLKEWLPQARSNWAFPGAKRLGPWTAGPNGYRPLDRLKQAGRAVGVEGFTFLSLRHSFMTHGRGPWGLGSKQIQQMAGHTLEETQDHYLGFDIANQRAAAAKISFPMPEARARA